MKKLLVAMLIAGVSLMAVDYSQMTTEELNALRGTIAVEDRDTFRAEMQSRVEVMTSDEQAQFMADRQATGGQGHRDGSGAGSMAQGANAQGAGMGQRLRDGSGAGSMVQGANSGGYGHGRR